MRLTPCKCRAEHYTREHRQAWMRLVWTRRLYHCYSCDAWLLLRPADVQQRLAREASQVPRRPPRANVAWTGP